ncbi:helix-turn-helix domain-containing protein, partial [Salmonella enterica]|uniref:helix-turn-helix domain-containing protein n=1 Tax=Salmonella enterica TaxID=28901 RepID=UPI003EDBC674
GLTPQGYLSGLRLIKGRHLLGHSDHSVTEIADRCGFGDSDHVWALLRRESGWSPGDMRQRRDARIQ